jgi:uncharacterized protein (TIGR00106 family)
MTTDYAALTPPEFCIVDFSIIPIGSGSPSVSSEIAAVTKLLEASGIAHETHATGTTVEGKFEDVMRVIGQAHTLLHNNGTARVHSSISVSSRTDKKDSMKERLESLDKSRQLAARKILT